MKLLIDNGNSLLKIAAIKNKKINKIDTLKFSQLDEFKLQNIEKIFLANTNQNHKTQDLKEFFTKKFQAQTQIITSEKKCKITNLKNFYIKSSNLGVDRWLSMIFCWHKFKTSCSVISCGTFTTYDEIDKKGNHLGGFIIPSLDFNKQKTCDFFKQKEIFNKKLNLANNTQSAINNGCNLSFIATIKYLTELRSNNKIIITGGNSKIFQADIKKNVTFIENLPLKGLLIIANFYD